MVILLNLLHGRLTPGVYHLFGGPATGKTTMAMACAASVAARDRKVAWIDSTKGFSPARFAEISRLTHGIDWSRNVLYMKAPTADALDFGLCAVTRNQQEWRPGLLVVDTIFGSLDVLSEDEDARRAAWDVATEILGRISMLAPVAKLPVLVLNTVGYKLKLDQDRPTGERLLEKLRAEIACTRAIIGPGGPSGEFEYLSCDDDCRYRIVAGGIEPREVEFQQQPLDETDEGGEPAWT
jgi:hypothetical protein